jgi:hypothetical protein
LTREISGYPSTVAGPRSISCAIVTSHSLIRLLVQAGSSGHQVDVRCLQVGNSAVSECPNRALDGLVRQSHVRGAISLIGKTSVEIVVPLLSGLAIGVQRIIRPHNNGEPILLLEICCDWVRDGTVGGTRRAGVRQY